MIVFERVLKMERKHIPYGPYERWFKRPFDVCCALAAIVVFCWLYILVAVLVRIKLGSPVLFTQDRPGRDEKIFKLYKFRSMTDARDAEGNLLPNEIRLTPFGRRLRAWSLDELPEAFNILKGDMSVVGPRPLLARYLPRYNAEQRRRHEVRPGLSGLAQIHGRNTATWDEKFQYDIAYVDHVTFWGDVKIIVRTFFKALKREGINAGENLAMPEFFGTEQEEFASK